MTVQSNKAYDQPPIKRSWRAHLVIPMLVAGGLLTLSWIVALIAVAFQIIGAIAGTGTHG